MSAVPVILHVDMDAFYASIELSRRPDLVGRPMWVGGAARGVVLSASYEARACGVRSGMSSTRARRLCPSAVAIPPDFDTYAATSKGVFAIFRTVTSQVEAASIDEAFLDITGALRRLGGDPVAIGERLRAQVADEQRVSCSVGIAPNKFLAKLASTRAKPDGLVQVRPEDVITFLHPLPVEAMWGVGESTAAALHKLGLTSVADLAHTPRTTLHRAFGATQGTLLHDLAWGRDTRRVSALPAERSIGSQETFSRDTDDPELIATELLRMSARTAERMRWAGVLGRTVSVSIRFADFTTLTRSSTMRGLSDVTDDIHAAAMAAYAKLNLQRARVRRVGVRVEGLVDGDRAYQQPTLDTPERGMREVERAADVAVQRFGPGAVRRASLTRRDRRPVSSAVDEIEGWS
ncbi:MAG TPA: DNA polymerase IV [Propionibacteriaceae bacterium]|nr:DNA polymerase IV [Propionibacteriaceae bacterium]